MPEVEQISNYRILTSKPLGKGACGLVYYGQAKTGQKVAVKSININQLTDHIEKQIKSEITNLKSLQSPFIVKMYDCFRSGEHLFIVLEFCEDGDLKSYLDRNRNNGGISEAEALTFMRHLMKGYEAMLASKIIHRDIKPANILLKQGVAKLSDFGFSRVVDDPTKTQKLSCLGTPLYTAPEVLARQEFSNSCDIWSMGIVFYEMLHGKAPWGGTDIENLYQNIKSVKIKFKDSLKPAVKDLISRMLTVDRHKRISWEELLKHPLFQKPVDLQNDKIRKEDGYANIVTQVMKYLENYLVKSYLLLNTNVKVQFAPSDNNYDLKHNSKSNDRIKIEEETAYFAHRRNFAFLHMYVLALYWKNKDNKVLPPNINYFMELQYGLIARALSLIVEIGQDFNKLKQAGNNSDWENYIKTPQFVELQQLLETDYRLLTTTLTACQKQMENRVQAKKLHPDTLGYLKNFGKKFLETFENAMKFNLKTFSEYPNKKGVACLIAEYIENYILKPQNILKNPELVSNFSFFYEKKEKEFGL